MAQAVGCLVGAVLLGLLLGRPFEDLQPIGNLISPHTGVWRHAPTDDDGARRFLLAALEKRGIRDVELVFDEDGIPHLSAESESSLYFAQGFITAYFRLWQMDFLSRLTAGRVAELLGEKALPVDRFFRRMKLPAAAEASADLLLNDLATRDAVLAYIDGVNARIEQIEIDSIPFEYRVFGTHPEPWTPERVAYLAKYMTWELTGYMYDYRFTQTKNAVSKEILELLFPTASQFPATILGDDEASKRNRKSVALHTEVQFPRSIALRGIDIPDEILPDPNNGSNNWAIHGKNTSTGKAILANDIHLSYTLPALWFPIQLTSPTQNVFGASLPGSPGVIIGFNEDVSWAVTNGTTDVLDWHSLRFRDENHREYLFNGTWRPIIIAEEKIWLPDGRYEQIKTRETHIGPILFEEGDTKNVADTPSGLAIQWTGLIPSNELKTFLLLNRARNSAECMDSLKGFVAPPQNFLCADRSGKISYRLSGIFPSRAHKDGRDVQEALVDSDVWQGFLTPDEVPQKDHVDDFIVSANQAPFNGDRQAKFGWFFANPYRAETIGELIQSAKKSGKIRPEDVVKMQADDRDKMTSQFLKWAMQNVSTKQQSELHSSSLCQQESQLEKWDGRHSSDSKAAAVAHEWLARFESQIWESVIGPSKERHWPSRWRLLETVTHEESFNSLKLEKSVSEVLIGSLKEACESLVDKHGGLPTWSEYQSTQIRHTGRLPGLGRKYIEAGGSAESVFANKGFHGPTWKMVVSMESPIRAWAMIPGGKSGDPASREYDGTLMEWSEGKMKPVQFHPRKAKK